MDKQDSIKCLKSMQQWIPDWDDREDGLSYWDAIDMAIAALSSPNEPMTLEQLREMDGEPVWVQTPGIPQYGRWVIVAGIDTNDGQKTLYCQGDYTCRNYGRDWIAYRRPKEEQ